MKRLFCCCCLALILALAPKVSFAKDFDDLLITYMTWRGSPYPLQINVGQFARCLQTKGANSELEEIEPNVQVLNISFYDKIQKKNESYRLVFETKDGAARAIATRAFMFDNELVGQIRDNTFLTMLIGCEAEKSKIPPAQKKAEQPKAGKAVLFKGKISPQEIFDDEGWKKILDYTADNGLQKLLKMNEFFLSKAKADKDGTMLDAAWVSATYANYFAEMAEKQGAQTKSEQKIAKQRAYEVAKQYKWTDEEFVAAAEFSMHKFNEFIVSENAKAAPATPAPASAKAPTKKAPVQICGEVTKVQGLVVGTDQFSIKDMKGKSARYYFDASEDDTCEKLVKKGSFICFDIELEEKNDMGLKALGVTEPILLWISNCVSPG